MTRVGRALALHEFLERGRDKWVLVVSVAFAALASAVSAYGHEAGGGEEQAIAMTGPSLVTLASLFVPLVALVLSHDAIVGERERNTLGLLLSLPVSRMEVVLAKVAGRGAALVLAVSLGIGAAAMFTTAGERLTLLNLIGPTVLLGLAFLSLGILLSTISSRQAIAASLVVVTWFGLVFFYDFGLLALMIVGDGQVSQQVIADLLVANPAGMYRLTMLDAFTGADALGELGLVATLPSVAARAGIWVAWLLGPVLLSGVLLARTKVLR